MAIRIFLTPPTLANDDENVIETLVEVATDDTFTNLVANASNVLESELYNVMIAKELVPGTEYFVRASFVTDKAGAEGWGPTVSFVAQNVVEQSVSMSAPDVARAPSLSIPFFGVKGIPLSNFRVDVAIDASIDADAVSADLLIEDVDGDVVVSTIGIDRDFRSIFVERWLQPDSVYKIGVSIGLASGAKSMFGSIVVTTGSIDGEFKVLEHLVKINDSEVVMQIPPLSDHVELELFNSDGMIYSDYSVIGTSASYSSNLEEQMEIGRVRDIYSNGEKSNWHYFYKEAKPITLPLELPAPLGNK